VATECKATFISVKGPELLSEYIGESEANVRGVFQRARASEPSVIFFDEFDSLAPSRGRGSDSAGVVDRVVSSLLSEMDKTFKDKSSKVVVLAATNRLDLIDRAFLRAGRLDKTIYLGVPRDKFPILQASLRAVASDDCGVDVGAVAARLPPNFTGADVSGLVRSAMLSAVKRSVKAVDDLAKELGVGVLELQVLLAEVGQGRPDEIGKLKAETVGDGRWKVSSPTNVVHLSQHEVSNLTSPRLTTEDLLDGLHPAHVS
jgi:peroxin-6